MKIKVFTPDFRWGEYGDILSGKVIPRGYVEIDEFDAETVFNYCNWDCWAEEKPENVHTDIERVGHGLIVLNPITNEYHMALSGGWLIGDINRIKDYISRHKGTFDLWIMER